MAKIPCTNHCPPAICPYSSSINKIYWRQFPVTHRWNLLLQLFNLSPNLLILIIFPQSIVQISVLIPLCLKFLHFFQDLHRLDWKFLAALEALAFGIRNRVYVIVHDSAEFCIF